MTFGKNKLTPVDIFGYDPEAKGYYYNGFVTSPSPDKRFNVVFTPGCEYAMMRSVHGVALCDADFKPLPAFQALEAPFQRADWSPDSRVIVMPLATPMEGLLLYRPEQENFALVKVNPRQFGVQLYNDRVELPVDLYQFRAYFEKKFDPPNTVVLQFDALQWQKASRTKGVIIDAAAKKSAAEWKWEPRPSKELLAYAKKKGITINWQ